MVESYKLNQSELHALSSVVAASWTEEQRMRDLGHVGTAIMLRRARDTLRIVLEQSGTWNTGPV